MLHGVQEQGGGRVALSDSLPVLPSASAQVPLALPPHAFLC